MSLVKQNLGRTLPLPAAPAAAPAFSVPLRIATGGASLVESSVSRRLLRGEEGIDLLSSLSGTPAS